MNQSPWWLNRKIAIATITITVATITTIIRFTGGFETLELKRYDYFWTKRAITTWDERIIIVGYTEEDVKKYGSSPSDQLIRKVLQQVNLANPTTVGLFFRREAQPSDSEQRTLLNQQIKSIPFLIQADSNDRISPETDNIIRKFPFYQRLSQEPHVIWAVAKHYLEKTGASITENKKPPLRSITINYPDGNQAIIKPLTLLNDGGYNSSIDDLIDFQVLISWPYSRQSFKTYSFDTIINNPPLNFKDKIVIVGEMKSRNIFKAPVYEAKNIYSFLYSSEVAGIIISNILQQTEVPFVKVWNDPTEYFYFYGWMIASGVIVLWLCEELDPAQKWAKYFLSIAITWGVFLLTIYFISLGAFPKTWIPSVFIGRGVTFNIFFCSFACLELKVREEQAQKLKNQEDKLKEREKRLQLTIQLREEQEKRLEDEKRLNKIKALEIKELKKRLLAEARLAFLGRLNAGFNHEIKNILFQIDAASDNAKNLVCELIELAKSQSFSQEDYQDFVDLTLNNIDIISTQVKRSRNLRQQIIPDNFELEQSSAPDLIDVGKILNECLKLVFYSKSTHETITVEKDYKDNLFFIEGNIPELNFVFISLLSNAWDAIEEKIKLTSLEKLEYYPQLKIKVVDNSEHLTVIISDNGIDIPKEKEKSIFDFFYTTKLPGKGSGLGLSLAKDIITARHQGDINLEQKVDEKHFVVKLAKTYVIN